MATSNKELHLRAGSVHYSVQIYVQFFDFFASKIILWGLEFPGSGQEKEDVERKFKAVV